MTLKNSLEPKMTLSAVAKHLGVSRTTVSNAYNRPDQLSARLREEIIEKARELGYHGPNAVGRLLRIGKTQSIGLLFYDRFSAVFDDEFALQLIQGIMVELERVGVSLLMVPTMTTQQESSQALGALVDGFIVFCESQEASPVLETIRSRGLPLVAIDHHYDGIPMIGVDDCTGAKVAAQKVIERGHKNVIIVSIAFNVHNERGFVDPGFVHEYPDRTPVRRIRGYSHVFNKADVQYRIFETAQDDLVSPHATGFAEQIIDNLADATAIVCMADRLAIAIMDVARQKGLRIPEDLSIVGFDGIRSAQERSPTLSSICQRADEKGRLAVRMLLGDEPMESRILGVSWLEGQTLGPVPGKNVTDT
jgi:DNA-binding LacI/PurR family transcriptional regulator